MAEQPSGHLKNTLNHVQREDDLENLLQSERKHTVSFVVFVYWLVTVGNTVLFLQSSRTVPWPCYVTLWTFTIAISVLYLLRATKLAFLAAGLGAVSLSMFVYMVVPDYYFMGIVQTSVLMTIVATLYFHRVYFWMATATGGAMFVASFIIAAARHVSPSNVVFVMGLNGAMFWLMVSVGCWFYLKKSIWLFEKLSDAQSAMMIDALTKTYNRLYFDESLAMLEKRLGTSGLNELVSILMLDLDHFKRINDEHGHPVGDQVLVHFAETVQAHIRRTDVFVRVGGEEFALIVRHDHRFDLAAYADRLRMAVEQHPFVLTKGPGNVGGQVARMASPHRDPRAASTNSIRQDEFAPQFQGTTTIFIPLTTSIGGATFIAGQETIHGCVNRADVALYEGKTRGRNRVVIA